MPPVERRLTREAVAEYIRAVEDASTIYQTSDLVPPTVLGTLALGVILEHLRIPPGTLHGSQDLEFKGVAHVGQSVTCSGRVVQNQLRGGSRFIAVESIVSAGDGGVLLRSRCLIIVPAEA
ncbi:MAG: MaoC family dehydratase N-terminal domain-containing protein [Chloroflexi bacterium]|nr:MaoC family dehydratase N-terminal domain-containing protein [Chloroflexota bacterium]